MVERIKSNFVPFKKSQMVWLDSRHLKTNYHKKMAPKREGLFKIEEVLDATLPHPYRGNEGYRENYI
jgi:hypothetical protein